MNPGTSRTGNLSEQELVEPGNVLDRGTSLRKDEALDQVCSKQIRAGEATMGWLRVRAVGFGPGCGIVGHLNIYVA